MRAKKASGGEKPAAQGSRRELDWELNLDALQQTPGFMIRILQLLNFEAFYRHFEALGLSPVEYAILIIVRDNKTVTQSELAAVLKMHLPNLVKILFVMEEAGIMKRKRSARDKRAVELSLSAAGQRRADEASRLWRDLQCHDAGPAQQARADRVSSNAGAAGRRLPARIVVAGEDLLMPTPAQPIHSADASSSSFATAFARRVSTARWLM